MANNTINVRILQKYDSEANWAANNPILYYGEVAYSSDKNNQYKVGNGTSKWSQLAYNSVNKAATADSASNANALFLNPSNRQTSANLDLTSTSLNRRVTYMLSTSTMTEGMPPSTGHILTFGWDTTAGLGAQLAIGTGRNGHMYIRGASDVTTNGVSSSVWAENWFTLLDSNNYSSYAAPKSHASSTTTYGIGTASNYGHVKLSDTYTSALGAASTGIVPSQSALYNAYSALNTKFNGYLPLTGGTLTGNLNIKGTAPVFTLQNTSGNDVALILDRNTKASWKLLVSSGDLYFQNNWVNGAKGDYFTTLTIALSTGNAAFKGTVTAPTFIGNLTGAASKATTADSATKWTTARTLKLTGSTEGAISFDGSGNATMTTTEGTVSFKKMGIINQTTDWNTLTTPGCYKVQMSSWGDADTYHSPNTYGGIYSYGLLLVFKSSIEEENRTIQIYFPHSIANSVHGTVVKRMLNKTTWNSWGPLFTGTSKSYIGLGNVDNTSDSSKNVLSATKWTTARTMTIGSTGKSVNGTTNVAWTLDEIGAAAASHTHNYLPLTGGTVSNTIHSSKFTSTYLAGNQGEAIINSTVAAGLYVMLAKMNSTNGYFTHGTFKDKYLLQYTVKSTVDAGTNNVTKSATLLDESGNAWFPGTVNASDFVTTSANCFRNKCGNYGFIIRNDGANTYFLLTNSGDQSGPYNNLRPFYFSNSSGLVTMNNGLISAGVSKFTNSTESTSASSGAVVISGGLGVAKQIVSNGALFVGHGVPANASIYLNGKLALKGNDTWLRINESQAFTAGTHFGTGILRTDGTFQVGSGGSSINITTSSIQLKQPTTISNTASITNTTASTSKSTGALKVSGGVGITGQVNAQSFKINEKWALQVDAMTGSLNFVMA